MIRTIDEIDIRTIAVIHKKCFSEHFASHLCKDKDCKLLQRFYYELSECKYGFIIRKESPVNFVATPTKLSNYLASGLIPIVSNTVEFFSAVLNKCHYAILLEDNKDITPVVQMSSEAINPNDVFNEYNELFKEYFNDRKHIENIKLLINRLCINYES